MVIRIFLLQFLFNMHLFHCEHE